MRLEKYDVYEWVDEMLVGAKVIDTKWVLKQKREKDANDPKHFEARLTVRGFTQQPGIDFSNTYVLVY